MRIFKNKAFNKWAMEQRVKDSTLIKAIEEMEQGSYEASLGGSIYKKRIPLDGRGKRGGARVIVAFKLNEMIIFIYGFPKNQKDNITDKEKDALQALAKVYFSYSNKQLDLLINTGTFIEVMP